MKRLEKKRLVFDSGDEKAEVVVLGNCEKVDTVRWGCLLGGGEQSKVVRRVMEGGSKIARLVMEEGGFGFGWQDGGTTTMYDRTFMFFVQ